ncbi:MAG: isochorismate synthase [Proteobacteria bacterium]|nr:isochorismate synthase [Pseudomonadota bacterium]
MSRTVSELVESLRSTAADSAASSRSESNFDGTLFDEVAHTLEATFSASFRWSDDETGECVLCFGQRLTPVSGPTPTKAGIEHAAPVLVFSLPFRAFGDGGADLFAAGEAAGTCFTPEWTIRLHKRGAATASIAHHRGVALAHQPPMRQAYVETRSSFMGRVAKAADAARFVLSKVVLARAERWSRAGIQTDSALHRRLLRANPGTICFSMDLGHGTRFVGATPERLVSLEAGLAQSMALAGTSARGQSESDDRAIAKTLLNDPKERLEHLLVVQQVESRLAAISDSVRVDEQPSVRRLASVQHLQTRVNAEVSGDLSLLDLVARLHPTPAVCGHPTSLARQWLADSSPLDRGPYAGPVGWMEPNGDGDAAVALRCAVIDEDTVTAFAGVGIVAASDPAREWRETELKLSAMRGALGGPTSTRRVQSAAHV